MPFEPAISQIYRPQKEFPVHSLKYWRAVQFLLWLIGFLIFGCLVFFPSLGVLLFWNILIPVAPALLVISTGLWRNICPLATTNLLPRRFNLSKQLKMPVALHAKFNLVAVILLFIIVPLRHAVFNTSGAATAALLFGCALVGFGMSFFYDWKSGWCSSLCPVHPVEKLYGSNSIFTMPNAHCSECVNCSIPCPDSTPNMQPNLSKKTNYHNISGALIIGGLPGFIWGWFHVPDHSSANSLTGLRDIYELPVGGLAVTLVLYLLLKMIVNAGFQKKLVSLFAAAAVSCYYWFRIPALFGFGEFGTDGLLVNLSSSISQTVITVTCILLSLFFFWWIVFRKPSQLSWVSRPPFKTA